MRTRHAWVIGSLLVLVPGCANPVHELWPPHQGVSTRTIIVSLDPWHAMIAFPLGEEQAARSEQRETQIPFPRSPSPLSNSLSAIRHSLFEEWGYAEQAWYLEGQRGFTGVLRVLLWFSPGVVEVGQHDRVWADRTPQPPSDRFTFHLSEEGYARLRRHLQASIASPEPLLKSGDSAFYPSVRSYNLLIHQCHQYAAHALREAGLPVSSWWAFSRSGFAAQLRSAARFAGETEDRRVISGAVLAQ